MTEETNTKPEPQTFADFASQPSGSGVAAEQAAFMEAALDDATAETTIDAGVADESAAYTEAMSPAKDGPGEAKSDAQPAR